MGHLSEADYSELIDYIIEKLKEYQATDVIRQIRELEKVSIIEKDKPQVTKKTSSVGLEYFVNLNEGRPRYLSYLNEKPDTRRDPDKTVDKKVERDAVSAYCSRPMSCEEMYHAAIDILEAYLVATPQIIDAVKKEFQTASSTDIIWKNESTSRIHEERAVSVTEAVGQISAESREEMEQIIQFLKSDL